MIAMNFLASNSNMTKEELKEWQLAMGYTQQQAADALGVSRATYRDKLNGFSRNTGKPVLIDRITKLACAYLLDKENRNNAMTNIEKIFNKRY